MALHLQERFPEQLESRGFRPDQLEPLALRGLAEAKSYGIINEGDVPRYIECMVLISTEFDKDPRFPWAARILGRTDIDGEAKMDLIDEYVIFHLRAN